MERALTEQAQMQLRRHINHGDVVIDATAGNGHDTLFLAGCVGARGRVFAMDNQAIAIEVVQQKLQRAGLHQRVSCLCCGHEQMLEHIPADYRRQVKAVMFNLGYLPGGDKSHITHEVTTLQALQQAYELLQPGGVISVIAYTGHAGGREEAETIKAWVKARSEAAYEFIIPENCKSPPPELLWLLKPVV